MTLPRVLVIGAAALAVLSTAAPASPQHPRDRAPVHAGCATPGSATFPITTRLSGGPDAYERGGAPRTWRLELRNATGTECRNVHPVAVLADRGRVLRPGDIRLDFYDPTASRWRPVRFERTDEAENVGVFEGRSPEFPGFSVPARGAVPVRVRLAFTEGAPEGRVTANVTTVQRRGADGDWVGESNDYAFGVGGAAGRPAGATGGGEREGQDAGQGPALADTGSQRHLFAIGAAAFALLLAGGSLFFGARRGR
ncbi:hypothetical protein ACFQ2B_20530 [Streptomyces stramineus]|uniref:Gram-positive cocci surface proteins LPxTG domain-containing protein n=1 Tax=Streptomyces stramineus TaxID=173861 RepID=A0ABN1A668_9ACTN